MSTQPESPNATSPTRPSTVPARHFRVLIPVAVVLALVFHFWWPTGPGVLRALVGTVVMVVAASAIVLLHGRRRSI